MSMHLNALTTALQRLKSFNLTPWRGFEPGIFCSGGGHDVHYATPQGQLIYCFQPANAAKDKRPLEKDILLLQSGLPDGIFLNQKSRFG
jgi:hypothetical protein